MRGRRRFAGGRDAVGLERAIAVAAGKQIWLVGPIPEIGYVVPRAFYLEHLGISGAMFDIQRTRAEFNSRRRFVFELFAGLMTKYPVRVVWLRQQ